MMSEKFSEKIRTKFRPFRNLFVCFVLSKNFQKIGGTETIRLVRKSSKLELSARFLGLKFFKKKSLPWTVNHISKIIRELNPQLQVEIVFGYLDIQQNFGTPKKIVDVQNMS